MTAAADEQRNIFDFFGLAQELRDYIYDHLLSCTKHLKIGLNGRLYASAHGFPSANLALVNRQFRNEYVARSAPLARVVVDDHLQGYSDVGVQKLPTGISVCTQLHLNLYVVPDEPKHSEADMHAKCIKQLMKQLPRLRSSTVDVHLRTAQAWDKQALANDLAKIIALPTLSTLDLFHINFVPGEPIAGWDYSQRKGPVMKWVQETGTIEDFGEQKAEESQ
ncbi:hypothetical protein LTR36_003301 [Oleoguttula mirabilis]|uniref:Uncharacterized protein n=1 Tax=Oleoguttula mirabilis TaxID=1507867 RepID=A0AAV9JXE7_9PEZI|nr:hypothetical protein LTR36_003301 [Oleoguttula mirabilis]